MGHRSACKEVLGRLLSRICRTETKITSPVALGKVQQSKNIFVRDFGDFKGHVPQPARLLRTEDTLFGFRGYLRHFRADGAKKDAQSSFEVVRSRKTNGGLRVWEETEGLTDQGTFGDESVRAVYQQHEDGSHDTFLPVKAYYIARSLDLKSLIDGNLRNHEAMMLTARNNVIIRFSSLDSLQSTSSTTHEASMCFERYLVAFQYGAIVLFNFNSEQEDVVLDLVKRNAVGLFKVAHKDEYGVVLRPNLKEWSEGGCDYVVVKQLDTNNIRVISSILGQSVALDYYARKVDEMVTTFRELNQGMEQTGTFTMKRKKLFQLVAAANTTLADVILRIGLLERSDTAWRYAQYSKIWEYLRDDFELEERFESLDFKLNIIQHNVRFFLDILQNRKSDTLEWIIILLIAGEICVSLYEIIHTAMKTGGAT